MTEHDNPCEHWTGWNYRIVRAVSKMKGLPAETWYSVREVYWKKLPGAKKEEVAAVSRAPDTFVGDSPEEVLDALRMALRDCKKHPVVDLAECEARWEKARKERGE